MTMRMRSLAGLLPFGVVLVAIVGCGGDSTSRGQIAPATEQGGVAATEQTSGGAAATERSSGGAAATRASEGGTAATSDTGGGAAGANMCPDTTQPDLPITTLPSEPGCYVGTNGVWHAVPCVCDLWVDSPRASDLSVSFSLSFTPTNLAPSFDGDLDVEVEFPDADATWFDTWQRQAERNLSFAVTHSSKDGTTIVRLGQNEVTLEPVPLKACESRHPRASIDGPWGTDLRLQMVATLADQSGYTVTTINNDCDQPAGHPTPFQDGEGGAAGSPL
jgi:hypothetical protein